MTPPLCVHCHGSCSAQTCSSSSCTPQPTLILWNASDLEAGPVANVTSSLSATSVAFSPDGQFLASTWSNGTLMVWNVSDMSAPRASVQRMELLGGGYSIATVAWSPDGSQLVTGDQDDLVVWTLMGDHLSQTKAISDSHPGIGGVEAVAWCGSQIVSGGGDKKVKVWDSDAPWTSATVPLAEGEHEYPSSATVKSVACAGNLVVSGSMDTTIKTWDAARTTVPQGVVDGFAQPPHPTGRCGSSGGNSGGGQGCYVHSVAPSPTGVHVASASQDGAIRIYDSSDIASGPVLESAICDTPCFDRDRLSVAWSPSGTLLAVGSKDGTVSIWNASE